MRWPLVLIAWVWPLQALGSVSYPPEPYLLDLEGPHSELTDGAKQQLVDTVELQKRWPDHDLYFCASMPNEADTHEPIAAIEAFVGSENIGSDIWSNGGSCPETLPAWLNVTPSKGQVLVGLFSAEEMAEILWARIFARADYVPDEGWPAENHLPEQPDSIFYENWFGDHLAAMGEPSFASADSLSFFASRFRFAAYPNSTPAYAVRIDQHRKGRFAVNWAILDGAGGYAAGKVAARGGRRLTEEEVAKFTSLLEAAEIDRKPMVEAQTSGDQGDGKFLICIHGTHWTFETLSDSGRRFLERDFCGYEDASLDALVNFGIGLTDGELGKHLGQFEQERFGD